MRKETKLSPTLLPALDRLARSQWGQFGCGAVPDPAVALRLVRLRLIRPAEGRDDTWALTLRGWRARQELVEARELHRVCRPRAARKAA